MEPDRKGLVAVGLSAAFCLLLGGALAATGAWRNALFLGAADAATAAAGPGFFDLLFDAVIPDRLAEKGMPELALPAEAPEGAAPSAAEAAAMLEAAKAAMAEAEKMMNCSGEGCEQEVAKALQRAAAASAAAGGGAEDGAAAEEEEERLRLIKMRERAKGDSRSYGGGSSTARPQKMSAADVEASFGGMIQRLKNRAGKESASPTLGGGGADPSGRGDSGSGGGDDTPIMTRENQSDKLNSPTLRALQKLNKDSRHSVGMSRDSGTVDGSRDKAGKSFDGNKATFGAIPIAETTGAMGRKQIKAVDETPPAQLEGQPVR